MLFINNSDQAQVRTVGEKGLAVVKRGNQLPFSLDLTSK